MALGSNCAAMESHDVRAVQDPESGCGSGGQEGPGPDHLGDVGWCPLLTLTLYRRVREAGGGQTLATANRWARGASPYARIACFGL